MTRDLRIDLVRTDEQAGAVRDLAYAFVDWLRARYPEMHEQIDTYLEHQKFDQQIREVLRHYTPPKGECLLATVDDTPVGILMLKDLGDTVCEMNRMFVHDSARGMGVGRALLNRLMARAVEMGFTRMNLSALPRHHEAIALYRSCGFVDDTRVPDAGNSDNSVLMTADLTGMAGTAGPAS